ncbi:MULTISPECIES: DUF2752 domain-containing protein [unclassified Streptomyces]|uniref:DUF2752 domain-containing protein n=1 Tax=unclassified Streptomyces TaxID=2593676 RepID=UPI001906918C|nr:DUF2752 domain-containing protein [Streptomyces sp. HSG2]
MDVLDRRRPAPTPKRPGRASTVARVARPVAVLAGVVGAFAFVAAVDPNEPGHYPGCPLLEFTGIHCPGCGGLRSAHAFAHGDLATALQANAPAVCGYLAFLALWTAWVVRAARDRPAPGAPGRAYAWGLSALLLVFTVVRNLPPVDWLRP